MAFRTQKAICAFVVSLFCGLAVAAEPLTIPVRHTHIRKGALGEIVISESSMIFRESGKKQEHSREWAFEDIQQLSVAPHSLRILTYEDEKWKLGRDREIEFDQISEGDARRILSAVRGHIDDRRLVVVLPDQSIEPLWQIKAKLQEGRGGSEGSVLVGTDSIVYKSEAKGASRTWHFGQIRNISSSGPFDLTINTFERDFRFQLKTELSGSRYQALWSRLNRIEEKKTE